MSSNGERWARGGLAFGAALSLMGNVAHTALATTDVSLWLRVPLAVAWPVALFVGIEVLVRIDWRRGFIDWLGRVLLWLPVSVVAAVVSYRHLFSLMGMAGEDSISRAVGPLAIDGLMLGCTVALLATRAARLVEQRQEISSPVALPAETRQEQETEMIVSPQEITETVAEIQQEIVSALPIVEEQEQEKRESAARPAPEQMEKAVRALLSGESVAQAAEIFKVGRSTLARYGPVMRKLRDEPHADIDCKAARVNPALVAIIRHEINRERAL